MIHLARSHQVGKWAATLVDRIGWSCKFNLEERIPPDRLCAPDRRGSRSELAAGRSRAVLQSHGMSLGRSRADGRMLLIGYCYSIRSEPALS